MAMVRSWPPPWTTLFFLLDAFFREKQKGLSPEQAMINAIDAAINSIFANSPDRGGGLFGIEVSMKFTIGLIWDWCWQRRNCVQPYNCAVLHAGYDSQIFRWNDKTRHYLPALLPEIRRMGLQGCATPPFIIMLILAPPLCGQE